jgi:hypothetical protein
MRSTLVFCVLLCAFLVLCQDPKHITKVHIVSMTHLDLGFTERVTTVINQYFDKYYFDAIKTIAELERNTTEGAPRLIYTTHPFLINLLIDCPQKIYPDLHCPNTTTIEKITNAVRKGDLTYHAFASNIETEIIADSTLTRHAIMLSRYADKFFGITKPKTTMSLRDVPGLTRAVIPHLVDNGVHAISVGSNGANGSPETPAQVFRWLDRQSGASVLATWHPRGYGGCELQDCALIPGHKEALCVSFMTDNQGPPPANVVKQCWSQVQREFPNAKIQASTFDNFFDNVITAEKAGIIKLPVATSEISDVWMYGVPSDPLKMARYRLMARLQSIIPVKDEDPRIRRFRTLLLKIPEHTWGISINAYLRDYTNYSNADFHPLQYTDARYKLCADSWQEQRDFLNKAYLALEDHPLAAAIDEASQVLVANQPDFTDYVPISARDVINTGRFQVKFDESTGAIVSLLDTSTKRNWAGINNKLGEFTYQTFDDNDFATFLRNFMYDPNQRNADFDKPGLAGRSAHTVYKLKLTNIYAKNTSAGISVLQVLTVDSSATTLYGAYKTVFVSFNIPSEKNSIDIRFDMFNKTSTRIPESFFITFNPIVSDVNGFTIDKLGTLVSPLDIMKNGSFHQHGVTNGIQYSEEGKFVLRVDSPDVPIVAVGEVTPFPTPMNQVPDLNKGFHFNYYNNIWGTNYIMWYPYMLADKDGVMRYKIIFGDH